METLHYLTNELAVLESSITDLDMVTEDADADGYLLDDGTARRIRHGITPEGQHVIYMSTNGPDIPIPDDLEDARDWCHDMGDAPDDDKLRIGTGANRLVMATEELMERYKGNEVALDELAWYADKGHEVIASLA